MSVEYRDVEGWSRKRGRGGGVTAWHQLSPSLNTGGYRHVRLCNGSPMSKSRQSWRSRELTFNARLRPDLASLVHTLA